MTRQVRCVHGQVGAHRLAIAGLRVFGNEDGPPPPAPTPGSAIRTTDARDAIIVGDPAPAAVGY